MMQTLAASFMMGELRSFIFVNSVTLSSGSNMLIYDAASCCIIHDGRAKKFHLCKFGHLEFWEQYVETVDHAREDSGSDAHIDYLGLLWVYFEAYSIQLSDTSQQITENRIR